MFRAAYSHIRQRVEPDHPAAVLFKFFQFTHGSERNYGNARHQHHAIVRFSAQYRSVPDSPGCQSLFGDKVEIKSVQEQIVFEILDIVMQYQFFIR